MLTRKKQERRHTTGIVKHINMSPADITSPLDGNKSNSRVSIFPFILNALVAIFIQN